MIKPETVDKLFFLSDLQSDGHPVRQSNNII